MNTDNNYNNYEHNQSSSTSDWNIKMGFAILAARAQLTPQFFIRPVNNSWKDSDIAAVNKFHNAMVGQNEYLRNPKEFIRK